MSKPKILRLSEEDSAQVSALRRALSDTNSKSLPDLNSTNYTAAQQYADECEMAEINANSSLQAALKLAIGDAENRNGRFVN